MRVVLSLRQQLSDETSQRQADYDERMGKLTEQYNDLLQQVSSTAEVSTQCLAVPSYCTCRHVGYVIAVKLHWICRGLLPVFPREIGRNVLVFFSWTATTGG